MAGVGRVLQAGPLPEPGRCQPADFRRRVHQGRAGQRLQLRGELQRRERRNSGHRGQPGHVHHHAQRRGFVLDRLHRHQHQQRHGQLVGLCVGDQAGSDLRRLRDHQDHHGQHLPGQCHRGQRVLLLPAVPKLRRSDLFDVRDGLHQGPCGGGQLQLHHQLQCRQQRQRGDRGQPGQLHHHAQRQRHGLHRLRRYEHQQRHRRRVGLRGAQPSGGDLRRLRDDQDCHGQHLPGQSHRGQRVLLLPAVQEFLGSVRLLCRLHHRQHQGPGDGRQLHLHRQLQCRQQRQRGHRRQPGHLHHHAQWHRQRLDRLRRHQHRQRHGRRDRLRGVDAAGRELRRLRDDQDGHRQHVPGQPRRGQRVLLLSALQEFRRPLRSLCHLQHRQRQGSVGGRQLQLHR